MEPSKRRVLPHTPPPFVPAGEIFFLTLCGDPRGRNQFSLPTAWNALRASAEHQHTHGRFHVRLLLAMPDHVHALAAFPQGVEMKRVVSDWKHFLARTAHFDWQRDFFDHRLRTAGSLDEKASYVRLNPVRAGLVAEPGEWPYVWSPPDLIAVPFR